MNGSRPGQGERAGWAIGVDAGGTWVRVAAVDARGRRRRVRAPAPGVASLAAWLEGLWRQWSIRKPDTDALVVATRGVWTPSERARLGRAMAPLARHVRVMSDAEGAYLAGLGEAPGVLLLAGTGSMALGRDARGRWTRAGGLGPLLGDEGSAFWLGRQWLRQTAGADGLRSMRRLLGSPDPVARIAALAPAVLAAARTRPRARAIVAEGQAALADTLAEVVRALRLPPPIAVSWGGSLLDDPRYRSGVWRAARRRGLALAPHPPRESAVTAALRLATSIARNGERSVTVRAPATRRRRR